MSAFLSGLLHVSQHDGNWKSKPRNLPRAFHSCQVPRLHRGWEVCTAKHVAGSASKPTPQFGHAEPSTDQIPCADLVPGSGQRQSRAVLPEYACFCLPGTSFLSCDQTGSPCRPSRLTYSRCFEGRRIWNGEGGTASRQAWLPSHVTRSRGSPRCSAGVDVLKDIAQVCPTSTFFLRRKRRPSCIIPSPE